VVEPVNAKASSDKQLKLQDGSRVAVMGGGPAGSFFSYFLLDMAERVGLEIELDLYEPRDYSTQGPKSCNMCGGIISESLVQSLAAEGIILPSSVVERGIDSYVLHTDIGRVHIDTPLLEKRIAAVYRGAGPKGIDSDFESFDGYLQKLASERGARVRRQAIDGVEWNEHGPLVRTRGEKPEAYDLLVVATGVNSSARKVIANLAADYAPPRTVKTMIREYYLGADQVATSLGNSMHVYLLDMPRLEFAAVIPKGANATICMLGEGVDRELLMAFLGSGEVRQAMPTGWEMENNVCQCSPKMNIGPARQPFADRLVFVGDSGVARLYKDGIGAAYRTAKAAARAAVFQGVGAEDFRRHYWPTCRRIERDNKFGRVVFGVAGVFRSWHFLTRVMLAMVREEQSLPGGSRRMSTVLWDMFTGSAPYLDIFWRTLHPAFLWRLAIHCVRCLFGVETKPHPAPKSTLKRA
jgi:flavin-dependent dehydrogenase